MQDPRNLSWLQFNQTRKFPLLHGCTARSADGEFVLPDDLITGLYLSYNVHNDLFDPGKFYIRRFIHHGTGFIMHIAYSRDSEDGDYDLAGLSVDYETTEPGTTLNLLGTDAAFLSGHLTLGGFSGISQQPIGEWEFTPEATTLDPFCIRFAAKELSALYVQNANVVTGPFYGNIRLIAGENIALQTRSAASVLNCLEEPVSKEGTEVIISSVPNAPLKWDSYIKSINGVLPDSQGNIEFIGQACLTISPQGDHALLFHDKCAEPCCTCEELQPVEQKMREFNSAVSNLASKTDMLYVQAVQLMQIATILVNR